MRIDEIRDILVKHGRLSVGAEGLEPTTDLYAVGLSSMTTVHLMLALEDHFEVEFPAKMLSRKTFQCLQSIAEAVDEVLDNA